MQTKKYDKAVADYNAVEKIDPSYQAKELKKNKKKAKKAFLKGE